MTSDERVQIFVPSPSGGGTPYSTITKSSNQEFLHKVAAQARSVSPLSGPRPTTTSISWHEMTSSPGGSGDVTTSESTVALTSSSTDTRTLHKPAPLADAETLTSSGDKSLEEEDHHRGDPRPPTTMLTTSGGDTIVDSDLPSLPTDGVVVTRAAAEEEEPVSLSDVSLTILKSPENESK